MVCRYVQFKEFWLVMGCSVVVFVVVYFTVGFFGWSLPGCGRGTGIFLSRGGFGGC